MNSPLIKKFGKEERWVNWKLETVKGRTTKIPYGVNGKKASSTDTTTWSTAKVAIAKSDKIGIVLTDKKLVCIDIDHVLTNGKIDHDEKEKIADLILAAESYTEISQSGTGLHIFVAVTEPIDIAHHKKAPFEIYNTGRYICTTGKSYGKERSVRTMKPAELLALLEPIISQKKEILPSVHEVKTSTSSILDDTTLLKKMFKSKNGEKIEKLYNGDLSEYKGDGSSGDMSLCTHLAFWAGKEANQIERIWLASPLGSRKKTKERKYYRDRTIAAAIARCTEVYKVPEAQKPALDLMYTMKDDKKIITLNTENIYRVLSRHEDYAGRFRYDTFRNMFEIYDTKKKKWRNQEDNDAVVIQTSISVTFPCFSHVGKGMVFDAIIKVTKENSYDSAADWVSALVWDKQARLDSWLSKVYGVEENVYHTAVGANWLKGLVKRIVEPGCKFDYVLVLEGEQGVKKSTSLYVLGGDWHAETTMSTDTKDFFMQFAGKAIIEFSEGETLSRTEVKRMKAIITMQSDRYRLPFERSTQDFPRRCVFAMTTNQTEYLKDETGNRRWLPVAVVAAEADIAWLEANRDQLFAEAYHRVVTKKETIWEFPKEETEREQRSRMIHDPNEDLVNEWYHNELRIEEREAGITVHMVYNQCLHRNVPTGKPLNRYDEMMIAEILKGMGLVKKRIMKNGVHGTFWMPEKMSTPSELEAIKKVENDRLF